MSRLAIITLVCLLPPSLCQYAIHTGLRPDVSFGDHNDRFDVASVIRHQTKLYKPNIDPQSEEFRRSYKSRHRKKYKQKQERNENEIPWPKLLNTETGRNILRKRIKGKLEDHVNSLANTIIHKIRDMRRNEEFSYHDNMEGEEGDVDDFNTNLRAFANAQEGRDNDFNHNNDFNTRRQNHLQGKDNVKYDEVFNERFHTRKDEDSNVNDDIRRQDRLQGIVNKLHGSIQSRRTASNPEKEILFHYAFPVDMKIEGFLQAPLN